MAGAVKPAPRAIFTPRSSGVIVVQAWRSLSGLRCRSAQSPSRPRPPPPRQGFSLLMLRQCRLPAELHASNLRWHPAFGSPRQDQVPLKLGEAAKDREHQQPCGEVLSAQGSPSERKPALASSMAPRVLSRSRVLRASRSNFVTSNTSPGARERSSGPVQRGLS